MILVIGLVLIIVGWGVQVYITLVKKDEAFNSFFLLLYVIGVGFLVAGNFLEKNMTISILNLISFLVALTLTVTVMLRRKGEL